MKGDQVIVVKGDLKNLKGWVEKVEEDNVHIRPNAEGLPVRYQWEIVLLFFILSNHCN